MSKASNEEVRALIEFCRTIEEADNVIQCHMGFETFREKIAFLQGMFGPITIVDKKGSDTDEVVYHLMLNAIINEKFA